jgi:4-diphosphocytidyl-2-C-methyl-D-erythritol kinase
LYDELTIKEGSRFAIYTNNAQLDSEQDNTIIRAKELISELTGIEIRSSITLDKRIPIGAGMGGGSSDGAAALLILNEFYDLELTNEDLYALALKIGSDVPFFIDPKPIFASSRGEIFEPTELRIDKPILIVNPRIHISTSWAFSKIESKLPATHLNQIEFSESSSLSDFRNSVVNDFEPVVFDSYSEIKDIKSKMYDLGAEFALMTGSGSTVFGIFPDISCANSALLKFPDNYFTFISELRN